MAMFGVIAGLSLGALWRGTIPMIIVAGLALYLVDGPPRATCCTPEIQEMMFKKLLEDARSRHMAKTITWRIVGTVDTILLGWLVSGDAKIGMAIGGLEVMTKMVLYYIHERAWYKLVRLGRK